MENPQKLTKAQKRELRKQEWQQQAEKDRKMQQYKKLSLWGGLVAVVVLAIFGLAMLVNRPSTSSTDNGVTTPGPTKIDFAKGNPKAKVVLTEYGDFQCPACASYHPLISQLLQDEGDKVYFVYRYFPLTNIHQNAHLSARAGYAASKQGKFWEMFDKLFETQTDWATNFSAGDIFAEYAKKLGLDVNKFKTDLNSAEATKFVDDSLSKASALGLNSTPSFFINGKKITTPGTYEEFKKLIDNELNKK